MQVTETQKQQKYNLFRYNHTNLQKLKFPWLVSHCSDSTEFILDFKRMKPREFFPSCDLGSFLTERY